jgi:hypothetical protein
MRMSVRVLKPALDMIIALLVEVLTLFLLSGLTAALIYGLLTGQVLPFLRE